MADEARSASYYLKVVSLARPLSLSDVRTRDPLSFGSFHECFRTSACIVLEFLPRSVDCGFSPQDTRYRTREEALGAAVSYLEVRGYRAVSFDLEGMVDAVH